MYKYQLFVDSKLDKEVVVQFRPNVVTDILPDVLVHINKDMSRVSFVVTKMHYNYQKKKWE